MRGQRAEGVASRWVAVRRRALLPRIADLATLAVVGSLLAVVTSTASPGAGPPGDVYLPLGADPVVLGAQVLGALLLTVAATALTAKASATATSCCAGWPPRAPCPSSPASTTCSTRPLLGVRVQRGPAAPRIPRDAGRGGTEIRSYWAPAGLRLAPGRDRVRGPGPDGLPTTARWIGGRPPASASAGTGSSAVETRTLMDTTDGQLDVGE